jgi:hypothetical protein
MHHVDPAMLRTAFYAMKRDAAPGVDGMTWETYEQDLDHRIEPLHARVQAGTYRALPSRRSYIPKEDGSKRPLEQYSALIPERLLRPRLLFLRARAFDRRKIFASALKAAMTQRLPRSSRTPALRFPPAKSAAPDSANSAIASAVSAGLGFRFCAHHSRLSKPPPLPLVRRAAGVALSGRPSFLNREASGKWFPDWRAAKVTVKPHV